MRNYITLLFIPLAYARGGGREEDESEGGVGFCINSYSSFL